MMTLVGRDPDCLAGSACPFHLDMPDRSALGTAQVVRRAVRLVVVCRDVLDRPPGVLVACPREFDGAFLNALTSDRIN